MVYHTGKQRNTNSKYRYQYYPEPDIVQPINARVFFDRLIFVIDRLVFQPDSFLVVHAKISK
jgi:hypothetical protein